MAGWLKKHTRLQEFMGLMKDQVSLGRAMAKLGQFSQVDIAILHATGHEEYIADEEAFKSVLEVGDCSRMCVSHCIRFLMDRLNKTRSWVVALKCLLVIHNCLHEGGFMFQDQLCICPSRGGHNYLNLSKFRDTSSTSTWASSAWVRWYARYIEQWIQTSKNLGIFLAFSKDEKSLHSERLISLTNWQLVKQIMNLEEFLHEAAGWEAEESVLKHVIVKKALGFISLTTTKAYSGMKWRFQEVAERISTLAQKEALELLDVCERLSEDSTSLMRLLENMESTTDDGASGCLVYQTFELEKLKQTLQHASLRKRSSFAEHGGLVHGLSHMFTSARWEDMPPSRHQMDVLKRTNSVCL